VAIKTKIEKYCDKFINNNYDRRDRNCDQYLKFEWFINSMHLWYSARQSFNSKPIIGKEISLGSAQGGDAFFVIANNQLCSLNDDVELVIKAAKQSKANKILYKTVDKSHRG
jgi:hypothetical protein